MRPEIVNFNRCYGRRDGFMAFLNDADKAYAFARQCSDQPLLFAAVANCDARRADAAREGGFRHNPAAPDGFDHVIAADDPVAIADQVFQEVEHLGLDRHNASAMPQLAAVAVESVTLENI